MRRGAIFCLSILVLLLAGDLGQGNASDLAIASSSPERGALTSGGAPGNGVPLGLSGGGGNGGVGGTGGPGNALDSGDDDDYWDGVNNDEEPPRSGHEPNLILLILEAWLHTEYWLLP